jgi:hypothetical protein
MILVQSLTLTAGDIGCCARRRIGAIKNDETSAMFMMMIMAMTTKSLPKF